MNAPFDHAARVRIGGFSLVAATVLFIAPLVLIPAGRGISALARVTAPRLAQAALWFASASVVSMMAGLLRWPTLR